MHVEGLIASTVEATAGGQACMTGAAEKAAVGSAPAPKTALPEEMIPEEIGEPEEDQESEMPADDEEVAM